MSEWRRFTAIQKAKRKGKKTGEESTVAEEIVVQRMSADVSGKQRKYTRIGPQEYVSFDTKRCEHQRRLQEALQTSDRKTSYL